MIYKLVRITTDDEWRNYHAIRRSVLWDARGKSGYDKNRPAEKLPTNHALILKLDDQIIGTSRLDEAGNYKAVLRLVAIKSDCQRQGHGRILSTYIEDYARRLRLKTLLVNADPDAIAFYEKMGWQRFIWDASELQGIVADCIQMTKNI